MNIYVGNLPSRVEENEIKEIFEKYGNVDSVTIMRDNVSGTCRGYGFVVMQEGWKDAVQGLNGTLFKSKKLAVNAALPRQDPRGSRDRGLN